MSDWVGRVNYTPGTPSEDHHLYLRASCGTVALLGGGDPAENFSCTRWVWRRSEPERSNGSGAGRAAAVAGDGYRLGQAAYGDHRRDGLGWRVSLVWLATLSGVATVFMLPSRPCRPPTAGASAESAATTSARRRAGARSAGIGRDRWTSCRQSGQSGLREQNGVNKTDCGPLPAPGGRPGTPTPSRRTQPPARCPSPAGRSCPPPRPPPPTRDAPSECTPSKARMIAPFCPDGSRSISNPGPVGVTGTLRLRDLGHNGKGAHLSRRQPRNDSRATE